MARRASRPRSWLASPWLLAGGAALGVGVGLLMVVARRRASAGAAPLPAPGPAPAPPRVRASAPATRAPSTPVALAPPPPSGYVPAPPSAAARSRGCALVAATAHDGFEGPGVGPRAAILERGATFYVFEKRVVAGRAWYGVTGAPLPGVREVTAVWFAPTAAEQTACAASG